MRRYGKNISKWWLLILLPVFPVVLYWNSAAPPPVEDWSASSLDGYVRCNGRDKDPTVVIRPGLSGDSLERAIVHENVHAKQMQGRSCRRYYAELKNPRVQLDLEAEAFCAEAKFAVKRFGTTLEEEVQEILDDLRYAPGYRRIARLPADHIESVVRGHCDAPRISGLSP
jgi:hypothetical protein